MNSVYGPKLEAPNLIGVMPEIKESMSKINIWSEQEAASSTLLQAESVGTLPKLNSNVNEVPDKEVIFRLAVGNKSAMEKQS